MLDSSKLKEFADDNFEFDENSGKFFKRVENTVGKGEIARCEQFLLFPQCFQKTITSDREKPGLVWERFNKIGASNFSFSHSVSRRLLLQTGKNQGLFEKGLTNGPTDKGFL